MVHQSRIIISCQCLVSKIGNLLLSSGRGSIFKQIPQAKFLIILTPCCKCFGTDLRTFKRVFLSLPLLGSSLGTHSAWKRAQWQLYSRGKRVPMSQLTSLALQWSSFLGCAASALFSLLCLQSISFFFPADFVSGLSLVSMKQLDMLA